MSEPRNTNLYSFFMGHPDIRGPNFRPQAALILACNRIEELETEATLLKAALDVACHIEAGDKDTFDYAVLNQLSELEQAREALRIFADRDNWSPGEDDRGSYYVSWIGDENRPWKVAALTPPEQEA